MRVLVTGATGWVGKSAVCVLKNSFEFIEVVGTSRTSRLLQVNDGDYIRLITNEEALIRCDEFDGIVHSSFPTQNFVEEMGEQNYRLHAKNMNDWFKQFLEKSTLDFAFLTSSGAVTLLERSSEFSEPYSELKREEELILKSFVKTNFAIGRLWAGSGRFMKNYRNYALGQFVEAGLRRKDIVVNSTVETFRQYCDIEQFCEVGIRLAMSGYNGTFDSGGERISIQGLAELIASRFEGLPVKFGKDGRVSRQPPDYFPTSDQFEVLAKELGIDLLPIDTQIERTIFAVQSALGLEQGSNGK